MRHARQPHGYGRLEHGVSFSDTNRQCGDEVVFYAAFEEDGKLSLRFSGEACALTMASASMICEALDKTPLSLAIDRLKDLQQAFSFPSESSGSTAVKSEYLTNWPNFYALLDFHRRKACILLPCSVSLGALQQLVR